MQSKANFDLCLPISSERIVTIRFHNVALSDKQGERQKCRYLDRRSATERVCERPCPPYDDVRKTLPSALICCGRRRNSNYLDFISVPSADPPPPQPGPRIRHQMSARRYSRYKFDCMTSPATNRRKPVGWPLSSRNDVTSKSANSAQRVALAADEHVVELYNIRGKCARNILLASSCSRKVGI